MAKQAIPKQTKTISDLIIVRAPQRQVNDVGSWRNALQSADMGRVKTLYDLYTDLTIDGVLSDALDKRTNAITNSGLIFHNAAKKEVPEINDLIESPGWEDMLTQIMQVLYWGRAGMEFDFTSGFGVTAIPKKHIYLNGRCIIINDTDIEGIPFDSNDNLVILGNTADFGLLLKAAPMAIYKRGGFGDYAQWLELFGMPQRVGKYSSFDPEGRKLLTQALEQAGSAPYIVIPEETKIETVPNSGAQGNGASYNDFRKACNEEMLITILGQTMTTVQGDKGARSLGEVHQNVEDNKHKADMRYVQRILNYTILPLLERRGFPVKGGKFVFPTSPELLKVDEIVSLSAIIDIPSQFIHDKYGIPIPAGGESIAGKKAVTNPGADPNVDPNLDPNADPNADPKPSGKKPADIPAADKTAADKKIKQSDESAFRRIVNFFRGSLTGWGVHDWQSPHAE